MRVEETHLFNLCLERGERREEEKERNISVWLPLMHPALGDLACNPGMGPDWELNQAGTQSTEPHQPGMNHDFLLNSLLDHPVPMAPPPDPQLLQLVQGIPSQPFNIQR